MTKIKKRPFYKALEGSWSRFWLFAAILLVTGMLHYSSVESPHPLPVSENQFHGAAAEVVTLPAEGAATAFVNVSVNEGRYRIYNNDTNTLVVADAVGSRHFDLPPGNYRIEFSKLFGYFEPKTSYFTLVPQDKKYVNCNYNIQQNVPALDIKITPPNGAYRIYNSANQVAMEATGSRVKSLPEGQYRIEFLEIPGFTTPAGREFKLINQVTTTIVVHYAPIN